jgi:hypothetical protein
VINSIFIMKIGSQRMDHYMVLSGGGDVYFESGTPGVTRISGRNDPLNIPRLMRAAPFSMNRNIQVFKIILNRKGFWLSIYVADLRQLGFTRGSISLVFSVWRIDVKGMVGH